jgi:glucokinase
VIPQRALGIDVGGSKILAGVVDREGRVDRREGRPTPQTSQEDLLAELDAVVQGLLGDDVAALGFGLPSTIDQRAGRAVASVHIPLEEMDIRQRMADRFHLPVGIDNDANAAAIAEWRLGAARGASYVVMLTLGTGIGGGLILDGKPYRGWTGAAAELGHIVLDYDGPPCGQGCTGHGHFEALAAGKVADEAARRRFGADANARHLVAEARAGHQEAKDDLAEIGRRLGAGLGSLVNVFDPEVIVLGGGFADAAEFVIGPARERLAVEALSPGRDHVRLEWAELGPDAGMIGSALVGFEALDAEG